MVDAFGVHIRGTFLASDAPLHQHQHMSDEHFLLNTERKKNHNFLLLFTMDIIFNAYSNRCVDDFFKTFIFNSYVLYI